jgi:hypothetical protein
MSYKDYERKRNEAKAEKTGWSEKEEVRNTNKLQKGIWF